MKFSFRKEAPEPEQKSEPMPTPDPGYLGLRGRALTVTPAEINLRRENCGEVWGVLMDMGKSNGVATVLAMAENSISLYFSKGGGILGAGREPGPLEAAKVLIARASKLVSHCKKAEEFPLPSSGNVRFYLLTFDGVYSAEAPETEFRTNLMHVIQLRLFFVHYNPYCVKRFDTSY